MNYSKNLSKNAMGKRVIVLLCMTFIVGLMVGELSGYTLRTHIIAKDEPKEEKHTSPINTKPLVYGAYDERCFTEEVSLDWGGDLDFTPLDCDMPEEQQEFVYYLCDGYNLDFSLVMAVIQHESGFDPNVISSTNDYGLMQINKCNHEWLTETLGVTDYTDPYQNIRAGAFVLRKLFEKYQEPEHVLMCYNMGEGGASRLWEKGIYETNYTRSVLNIQKQFNDQVGG